VAKSAGRIRDLAPVKPEHFGAADARDQVNVVGCDHHGRTELVQSVEQVEQAVRHLWIDVAGGLVCNQQFRAGR
jgi:hypothetical protein